MAGGAGPVGPAMAGPTFRQLLCVLSGARRIDLFSVFNFISKFILFIRNVLKFIGLCPEHSNLLTVADPGGLKGLTPPSTSKGISYC